MTVQTVEAIYEDGVLRPVQPLQGIVERSKVRVTVEIEAAAAHPLADCSSRMRTPRRCFASLRMRSSVSTLMNGSEIALDTNQVIAVLNNSGDTAQWLQSFAQVALPVTVIGELRFGALNSGKVAQNLEHIERLVSRCRVLNATLTTAEVYARIRMSLKTRGKPILRE